MSNIYIQEPPTSGKVLLITTVGDIDIELWCKETPKACRNFIQLCTDGYYNGTIFHRVVKDFIIQGGDPTGTGEGGQSSYGEPFKDEVHSRLRFSRRGLVAMANSGPDDNASQFFFTLGATPELQGKHTLFGKVAGDTIYNMLKLETETDQNERPFHCHKILKTKILNSPFEDIVAKAKAPKEKKEKRKEKEKGVKNFKLLSFGEEAEEDEEETTEISKVKKMKSSHDLLDDPKLSSATTEVDAAGEIGDAHNFDDASAIEEDEKQKRLINEYEEAQEDDDMEIEHYLGKEREEERKNQRAEIQKEIRLLKKDYQDKKKSKVVENDAEIETAPQPEGNQLVQEYKSNLVKYSNLKKDVPLKGSAREMFTMQMLSKFKTKLKELREVGPEEPVEAHVNSDDDSNDVTSDWMAKPLRFEAMPPVLARDASTKSDDWYDITDPRHPINKRRRDEKAVKEKLNK